MFRHPERVIHGSKEEELPRRVQAEYSGPGSPLEGPPLTDIASSLSVHETLRKWVRDDNRREAANGGGGDADTTSDERMNSSACGG